MGSSGVVSFGAIVVDPSSMSDEPSSAMYLEMEGCEREGADMSE